MLTLEHVSKSYGGLPVLNDLSLTLSEGEILALIGPSGCGKSTLLNIISGLVRPDAGSVSGADVKMSYMFQSARLLPWRTVRENIRIVRQDAAEEEVAAIIAAGGLQGFADYYPGQLSGGMARRCALARACLGGGAIFLMDEPFSGLDYGIRMEMVDMLLSIWRREKPGVLFVTHEIDEALTVATRIAIFPTGQPASATASPFPAPKAATHSRPSFPRFAAKSSTTSPTERSALWTPFVIYPSRHPSPSPTSLPFSQAALSAWLSQGATIAR